MRYTVILSGKQDEFDEPRQSGRKRRIPTEPMGGDPNLWVEHDTIPDAEVNSGVISGEILDDSYYP